MAIWFCLGTAAELIKVAPVIFAAQSQEIPFFVLHTGQSGVNFWRQWNDFQLPAASGGSLIASKADLDSSLAALTWFVKSALLSRTNLLQRVTKLAGHGPGPGDLWIVHGDTLSALMGAHYARLLGVRLAHLEAGLRSGHVLSPFPEEICRRLVSRLATVHFAQDDAAVNNLVRAKAKGRIVNTGGNTLLDLIHHFQHGIARDGDLPSQTYAVANIHRYENLHEASRWKTCIDVLLRSASLCKVVLINHPIAEAKLASDPGSRERLLQAGVVLLPRQPFSRFINLLAHSRFVISDGGSNQEECAYLGKPCLILRTATERFEGLDGPCVLSKFDAATIQNFLDNPMQRSRPPMIAGRRPTDLVIEEYKALKEKAL